MRLRYVIGISLILLLVLSVAVYLANRYVSVLPASLNTEVFLWVAAFSGVAAFLSQLKNVIELVEKIIGKRTSLPRKVNLQSISALTPKPAELLWNKYIIRYDLYDEPLSKLQIVQSIVGQDTYLLKTIKHKSSYQPETLQQVHDVYESTQVREQIALPIEILEDEDHFYEVLPYFKGPTLFELIQKNPQGIQGSLLESLAEDLLSLLAPLHTAIPPLVHGDINPYNILLRLDNLRLVLLDFSSASRATQSKTPRSVVCEGFAAPERYDGMSLTQSDVYSVGALITYLNTGRWPPKVQDRKYRGIELQLQGKVPRTVRKVIDRMVSLNPDERYATAQEVLDVFHSKRTTELLDIEPIGELVLPDGSKITMSYHNWTRGDRPVAAHGYASVGPLSGRGSAE